jgi:hypothetical protein
VRLGFGFGVSDFVVVFGVQLAGFAGVMRRLSRVAGGDMGVVASGFGVTGFVMVGGFAVVKGGLFVMLGGLGVMLVRVMGRHVQVLSGFRERCLSFPTRSLGPASGRHCEPSDNLLWRGRSSMKSSARGAVHH